MTFQPAVTVEKILGQIHQKKYLLPAIQREFVWSPDQVRTLFDSLMRGYPIGSFLLWNVTPDSAGKYTYYDFLTDYHEKDAPYANKAIVPHGQGIVAVLDGQQRLTALNIGVYGSYAEKKKYAWWNSSNAFPVKRLYLNVMADADPDDLGLRYDLKFLTTEDAAADASGHSAWFRVGEVLGLANTGPAMMTALQSRGIDLNHLASYERLNALYEALRSFQPINAYLEEGQDADKVLDIFVRVNSGGTTLSSSDLLLSLATNQWTHLDAREEVRSLVQQINTNGSQDFAFSKDVVLKTALMIAGIDLRFRVSNFTAVNMAKVESAWPEVRSSLLGAAALLSSFGLSARNLTADSVIIPIAHYLSVRDLGDSYLQSTHHAADRGLVRAWVIRSLVKRGIWGSGLDTLLGRLRSVIGESGQHGFPGTPIESAMAAIGKSLVMTSFEVDELLGLKYGGQRTFPVLTLLYPGLDLTHSFHEDHVFAKSRFTGKRLISAGIEPSDVPAYLDRVDLLPNLQLLPGLVNIEKQAALPAHWLSTAFANDDERHQYLHQNDMQGLPINLDEFLDFYNQRRDRMNARLRAILGVSEPPSTAEKSPT